MEIHKTLSYRKRKKENRQRRLEDKYQEKQDRKLKLGSRVRCRSCNIEKSVNQFPYALIEVLTYYQQETCKKCWKGKPYRKALLAPKDSKRFIKACEKLNTVNGQKRMAQGNQLTKRCEQGYSENNSALVHTHVNQHPKRPADTGRFHFNRVEAQPKWADQSKIDAVYTEMKRKAVNGRRYHVDHIIPIKHPLVCGLHVENNLQVLTARANLVKGNHFQSYRELPSGKRYFYI